MQQSTLSPAGPGAAAIESMWWVLFWVCAVVFVVVMVALGLAIVRSRRAAAGSGVGGRVGGRSGEDAAGAERRHVVWVLVAGAAIPAVILIGIFVYTMIILDRIGPSAGSGDLTVIVTGKQYWWEVRYPLPDGDTVVTANEIRIPAGKRVDLLLRSDDVVHSLWVPQLHGKTDMIPGRTNRAWLLADEPGVYRGQCAEYCGQQHTWMALYVVAQEEEAFRGWLARQRRPAAPVAPEPNAVDAGMDHQAPELPDSVAAAGLAENERIRRGRAVFLDPANRCTSCHVIRGENDARTGVALGPEEAPGEPPGRTAEGPDLTHVASRISLAGGMLTMNRGNMGGWIANPQVLKPGNLMPRVPLEPEEMNALLDYLMSLR